MQAIGLKIVSMPFYWLSRRRLTNWGIEIEIEIEIDNKFAVDPV
jgi:hypothetical protein